MKVDLEIEKWKTRPNKSNLTASAVQVEENLLEERSDYLQNLP